MAPRAQATGQAQTPRPARIREHRVPWGSISRDQVVTEATKVVKAGGYQEMTIRSLAAELGVSPMSLYRHVRDKDDLLDEVADRLLAEVWQPHANESDWQRWVAEAADKLRRFLVTQPAALHVYLKHPVASPSAIARMNAMMQVLRRGVVDEDVARRAYAAVHTYTIGFAALEASRSAWTPDDAEDELVSQLAAYTTSQQFAVGLRYLLQGIAHDAAQGCTKTVTDR